MSLELRAGEQPASFWGSVGELTPKTTHKRKRNNSRAPEERLEREKLIEGETERDGETRETERERACM